MNVPSLVVAVISLVFGVNVLSQYIHSRKNSHFFWAVSLFFSTLASFSYFLVELTSSKSAVAFALYYLLGALWMPAVMGLGSLSLIYQQRVMFSCTLFVSVVGLLGSVLLLFTPVREHALVHLDGGSGVGVYPAGWWLLPMIVLNTFGALAVLWVALVSAWRTLKKRAQGRFLHGNIWISIGILTIASAGSAARVHIVTGFWLTMLVGWVITYIGYRLLTPKKPRIHLVASRLDA